MKITKSQLRKIIKEARMDEYGKQDAAPGRPPSKVGRRDGEYMAAYKDEKENQISSREEKFGDALSAMGEGELKETDESFKDVMTQDSYLRVIEMLQEILEDSRERLENRAYSGVHLTEKISDILRLLERGY